MVTDACQSEDRVDERHYSMGSFQEGSYTVEVEYCALNPPPFPSPCSVVGRLAFDVVGMESVVAVPTNFGYAMVGLLAGIFFISIAKLMKWGQG
jgi:hypothetical protein